MWAPEGMSTGQFTTGQQTTVFEKHSLGVPCIRHTDTFLYQEGCYWEYGRLTFVK